VKTLPAPHLAYPAAASLHLLPQSSVTAATWRIRAPVVPPAWLLTEGVRLGRARARSGDGTMRKSPEKWSKWNVGAALANHPVQLSILQRALRLLAPGGKLVYSTCSLNPLEDEAVVAAALLTARLVQPSHLRSPHHCRPRGFAALTNQ
jgi:hypothetical protein